MRALAALRGRFAQSVLTSRILQCAADIQDARRSMPPSSMLSIDVGEAPSWGPGHPTIGVALVGMSGQQFVAKTDPVG